MDSPSASRDCCCYMAKVSEQAERFEDMVHYMKHVVTISPTLTVEERNQLSVAYKNVIGARRASWRIVTAIEQKLNENEKEQMGPEITALRKKVEAELNTICNEVLTLIDDKILIRNGSVHGESRVFYQKMKGDYYRYIAEFSSEAERTEAAKKAKDAYQEATDLASTTLPPTHPIRLGLALNYSVFYYEINNSPDHACRLAKSAFDEAIVDLDALSEDSYKDSTLIMQLLRDNLTLWTSDSSNVNPARAEEAQDQSVAHVS